MQLLFKKTVQIERGSNWYAAVQLSRALLYNTLPPAGYSSNSNHTYLHPRTYHSSDAVVIGVTSLARYNVPQSDVNLGERQAFVDCVSGLLLDGNARMNSTVKINVAWDQNDYQIDVASPSGVEEYKRIIDRNAQLGVTHIVYVPTTFPQYVFVTI